MEISAICVKKRSVWYCQQDRLNKNATFILPNSLTAAINEGSIYRSFAAAGFDSTAQTGKPRSFG